MENSKINCLQLNRKQPLPRKIGSDKMMKEVAGTKLIQILTTSNFDFQCAVNDAWHRFFTFIGVVWKI
ncbi:hypothetical protein LXM25_11845 [Dyadobacter sp. LJ53]|uniref:hypothetical protein n=1 Tax=Dyadobacter chenwenxiniae TaxID=2906456 RepID=UPI001F4195AB|nr:hypothetical protein [Dyadobacter chenwenxiniae]MCF0050755.1 hypothetical protein [Dyadobacter chenwenxiniae]